MCGILCAFSPEGPLTLLADPELSLQTLVHRGPDNASFYRQATVFLGHTRLSIIDTAAAANQPFRLGHLLLVFNGEIFNYIELREELSALGHSFRTSSDTEVVLQAFSRWGAACFERFNGMWSLAIYDESTGTMTVCRDRFGQKPLFMAKRGGTYVFASEIHALVPLIGGGAPNLGAIASFLREGDFDVGQATFFSGVFQFPSAVVMTLKRGGAVGSLRYWDYPACNPRARASDEEFHALLEDAVRIRLRTDVGYSILLSGGCDSTLIAALTRQVAGPEKELAAFTYSSGDSDDEVSYAARVAGDLSIQLSVSAAPPTTSAYLSRLRRLVHNLGRGHSSPAIVSSDFLYENVRAHGFKVALDGQGADELLAGYKRYHLHLLLDLARAGEWAEIPPLLRDMRREGLLSVVVMALRTSMPSWTRKLMRQAYGYERLLAPAAGQAETPPVCVPPASYRCASAFNRYLHQQHTVGLTNLLYYGDVVAMNNSVENRSPFMDHRLVDMAFATGPSLKVSHGTDKATLRRHPLYERFRAVLDRKKIGFSSPLSTSTKREMVDGLRNSPILDWPILRRAEVLGFLNSDEPQSAKYERLLFRMYQVHLWNELFCTQSAVPDGLRAEGKPANRPSEVRIPAAPLA